LICKLKVIEAKVNTKEKDENPVNQLEKYATYGNAAVILANIWTAQLVFDDWYQCSKQQDDGDMAVD
jgi:hypothetical protein